jgi:uncharacterized protein (DUF58 family)
MRLAASEPTGLFPFEIDLPVLTDLLVYPKCSSLGLFPLLGEGTLPRIGEEILSEPGASAEFRGVREWHPTDGQRLVHWPTTARLGRLMSKEFEQDIVTEVTIVLDLRRVAQVGLGAVSSLEVAVKAAASLAETALERQHLVQLFGLGAKRRAHLPFGAGQEQLEAVLDLLTLVRADGEGSYAELFDEVVPTLRRGATLIIVFAATAFEWDAMRPRLQSLILEGIRVVAVALDDRTFLAIHREQEELRRVGAAFEEITAGLREIGATVYTASEREDIRQRLEVPL